MESTITRRLDPDLVPPAHIRWYAEQMCATPAHVVSGFQRNASGDLRPLLSGVQTPTLILAAASLREEVLGDFRGAADLFPNGRLVVFPGVLRIRAAYTSRTLRPGMAGICPGFGAISHACQRLGRVVLQVCSLAVPGRACQTVWPPPPSPGRSRALPGTRGVT